MKTIEDTKALIEALKDIPVESDRDKYFYNFISLHLGEASGFMKLIGENKTPQSDIYMVKTIVKMISDCIDMKVDELYEENCN